MGVLLQGSIYAFYHPPHLVRGGPWDLSDPGDFVGVERIRTVKGTRSPERIDVKAIAGKILGTAHELYGMPTIDRVVHTLTEAVTGVKISFKEVTSLSARYRR
jgi:hypothetical protein